MSASHGARAAPRHDGERRGGGPPRRTGRRVGPSAAERARSPEPSRNATL
jgi:hypothetical protein